MTTYELQKWDLTELLAAPSGDPVENALAEIEALTAEFEGWREKLAADMSTADFNAVLKLDEDLTHAVYKPAIYSSLWYSEDTQNQESLAFQGRIQQALTGVQNRTMFFGLWWKQIDDENAERLAASVADDLRYHLDHSRLTRPYVLTEELEKLINIKNMNGISGLNKVYEMLTNAYKFTVTIDGEEQQLTRGQLSPLVQGSDAKMREMAYQELYRVFGEDGLVLAQIYIHLARDINETAVKMRGYPSPIATRNRANDVPDEAVDALLDVSKQNSGIFQRWFKLKAGYLGMDKLRRYDVYAPLSASEKEYPYQDAVDLCLDTFSDFSPKIGDAARRVFDENHIDAEIRPGKRSGAFCMSGLPKMTPYVLANYAGTARDVATIAHELGHAVHAMLAEDHPVFTFHSALPLAETASVFSEILLSERMLATETDPSVRRDLLASLIDDAYATVMRQAYFAMFEKEAHSLIKDGASVDQLNEAYMANLAEQFGDAVEVSEEFKWEWVSIPHIYRSPFYVYAYSFGQLLVFALYQRYLEQGEAFKPQYIKILSYGGSASPTHILEEAGIDINDPAFWQGGFDYISKLIDELEAMEG